MKFFRKVADERQRLEAMRIASVTVCIAILGLAIAIMVQLFVFGLSLAHVAGEFIIFFVCLIYLLIGFYRYGIGDYRTKRGIKSVFVYCFVIAFVFMWIGALFVYFRSEVPLLVILRYFGIAFLIIFPPIFGGGVLIDALARKRRTKLATKYTDDSN